MTDRPYRYAAELQSDVCSQITTMKSINKLQTIPEWNVPAAVVTQLQFELQASSHNSTSYHPMSVIHSSLSNSNQLQLPISMDSNTTQSTHQMLQSESSLTSFNQQTPQGCRSLFQIPSNENMRQITMPQPSTGNMEDNDPSTFVEISQDAVVQHPGLPNIINSQTMAPRPRGIVFYNNTTLPSCYVPVRQCDRSYSRVDSPMTGYQCMSAMSGACVTVSTMPTSNQYIGDDAVKKRQIHLMKNREAARVCRRKKKEYISCLEMRVTVLETQNRALVEELRSLKELFQYQQESQS